MKRVKTFHFVHALPNAWLPLMGKTLVIEGITAEALRNEIHSQQCEIVSHVRYEDHAAQISQDLQIDLPASGINAPSPYNVKGQLIVASLTPGTTEVQYTLVHDGTEVLKEANVWF